MNQNKLLKFPCFFCRDLCQMSGGVYELKALGEYGVMVCKSCSVGSHDSIAPIYEPILLNHLLENGYEIPKR